MIGKFALLASCFLMAVTGRAVIPDARIQIRDAFHHGRSTRYMHLKSAKVPLGRVTLTGTRIGSRSPTRSRGKETMKNLEQ